MSHPQPSARVSTGMGGCAGKAAGRCTVSCAADAVPRRFPAPGKAASHHCRNTGRGRGGFSRSGFRGDDKRRIPSSRSAVRHAKKTARPTCFTALPPFCRKTKFVPCMNDSFRMGTHTFIIPLLSRFVNVTSGLFRAESEKIHFRGRKTHNLNIFGVFVRLPLARQM